MNHSKKGCGAVVDAYDLVVPDVPGEYRGLTECCETGFVSAFSWIARRNVYRSRRFKMSYIDQCQIYMVVAGLRDCSQSTY